MMRAIMKKLMAGVAVLAICVAAGMIVTNGMF